MDGTLPNPEVDRPNGELLWNVYSQAAHNLAAEAHGTNEYRCRWREYNLAVAAYVGVYDDMPAIDIEDRFSYVHYFNEDTAERFNTWFNSGVRAHDMIHDQIAFSADDLNALFNHHIFPKINSKDGVEVATLLEVWQGLQDGSLWFRDLRRKVISRR